jgi:hypothetical protein
VPERSARSSTLGTTSEHKLVERRCETSAVSPDHAKLLRIYLDDHQTVLLAGRELARRLAKATHDPELASFLRDLAAELEDDRRRMIARLREAGGSPSRVKSAIAWTAVKAGRLKLNGSLTKPSPLSPVLELEGLGMVLVESRCLWRTLERTDSRRDEYASLAERAERRLAEVEERRLAAAERALRRDAVNGRASPS